MKRAVGWMSTVAVLIGGMAAQAQDTTHKRAKNEYQGSVERAPNPDSKTITLNYARGKMTCNVHPDTPVIVNGVRGTLRDNYKKITPYTFLTVIVDREGGNRVIKEIRIVEETPKSTQKDTGKGK